MRRAIITATPEGKRVLRTALEGRRRTAHLAVDMILVVRYCRLGSKCMMQDAERCLGRVGRRICTHAISDASGVLAASTHAVCRDDQRTPRRQDGTVPSSRRLDNERRGHEIIVVKSKVVVRQCGPLGTWLHVVHDMPRSLE